MKKLMAASAHLKTQTDLARRAGMAQSTIGRILRREVDPQSGNLERIARAFRVSLGQLAEVAEGAVAEPCNELRTLDKLSRVALVPWATAASFAKALDSPPAGSSEQWMPRPEHAGDRTFALRVRGESMESSYQHGDIIFVDPDVAPKYGKDVVVQLDEGNEVVFKRLVVEGELMYLKHVNPYWPGKIIEISAHPGARIVGVVIGKWVER